ncbi:MAG: hypothetical protein HN919_19050 [Verrucomicrobia bacterium]|nr:hypothetical protein [Verrucomicrobiota bacterium]MBT7068403.1 hypothetical protein [Verrucomicrobiota bacterium]MBT7698837.1 hypothetical protein [Verrucomicrobiota bacterium]
MSKWNLSQHVIIALLSVLLTGHALGQRQAPGARLRAAAGGATAADRDAVRLRKLVWQGTAAKIKTPEYRTTASKGVTTPGQWWQFTVEYDTKPEWTDALTFQFYVLAYGVIDGKKAYAFYNKRVVFAEIKEGRRHRATVFLRPNTVERYGAPVAFAVEVYYKGQMIVQETEVATKLSKTWWKDAAVIDSALVTKREGYLLNRAESAFAYVDVDAYETIKP